MENTSTTKLYEEFFKLVEAGTEEQAKDFLIEHLKEFPQKEQQDIIMAFFEDAIKQQTSDAAAVSAFQKKGIQTFEALAAEKKDLEHKAKLLEMKEKI